MAVADKVRENMPETLVLVEATSWGAGIVDSKVASALSEVFPDEPQPVDESSLALTPFQERYLGDFVTRLLIPAARDYYMVKTGRSDSIIGAPSGQNTGQSRTSGPGTGRQNYDRVAALMDLDRELAARLSADAAQFENSFKAPAAKAAGLMISTFDGDCDGFRTLDPQRMPRINERWWLRLESLGWTPDATSWT